MESKKMFSTATAFLLILSSLIKSTPANAAGTANVSTILAFGDSTLDPGNNNIIPLTLLRADHPPYGLDFPGRVPTGRFCDGKLITDFIVSKVGIKDILPAYHESKLNDDELPTGVSFASAGTGLDDFTAASVNVMTMGQQVTDFKEYLGRLKSLVGEEKANQTVANAVTIVSVGTNDMILNYYALPVRNATFGVADFHSFMLKNLKSFVQQLYSLGCRKFALAGLPPVGCLPLSMTVASLKPGPGILKRTCVDQQNADATAYNSKLQEQITTIKASLNGTKIGYADIYTPLLDMMKNPQKHGFETSTLGCCGSGVIEVGPLCTNLNPTCPDPSKYLFWDSVHPSQATYSALADFLIASLLPQI